MTGPAPIFEGELGLDGSWSCARRSICRCGGENGQSFMINQTYIKFWLAEYHSQSAIDAALQLRPGDRGTTWRLNPILIQSTFSPSTRRWTLLAKTRKSGGRGGRETADHSLPYCTAVALVNGEVTDAQFEREPVHRTRLLD